MGIVPNKHGFNVYYLEKIRQTQREFLKLTTSVNAWARQ